MSAAELRDAAERLRTLGTMPVTALALEVRCPTCNARAGDACQAMDGPARCTHKARRRSGAVLRLAFGLMVPCEEVADWLEAESQAHFHIGDEIRAVYDQPMMGGPALAVARRVLGGAS